MINPDAPHGYKPRVLTTSNLSHGGAFSLHGWAQRAVKDPTNRPCDICGGSRFGLVIHDLPARKPSLKRALQAVS